MEVINDNNKYNSVNSSSASITTIKISQQQQLVKTQSTVTLNHEDDSGIEQDSTILIRVCINEQSLQVVFI